MQYLSGMLFLLMMVYSAWFAVDCGIQSMHAKVEGRTTAVLGWVLLGIGINILFTVLLISWVYK